MLFDSNGNFENIDELSVEDQALIIEAALLDVLSNEELTAFLENKEEVDTVLNEQVLLEKSIVRLDKKAKLSRATKQAVYQIAAEKNDPKFKKLLNVWRLERLFKKYLFDKYSTMAMSRAKKAIAKAKKSKSETVKKVEKVEKVGSKKK